MEVLRGWRLLQAAGLTAEEKRDILSTTKNSLDYETIASALQNLWDEQLLGHRRGNGNTFQNFAASVDEGDWFDPESSDAWHDGWDDWSSSYYAGQWGDDEWGHDWWEEVQLVMTRLFVRLNKLSVNCFDVYVLLYSLKRYAGLWSDRFGST
ncbi:nosip [Symbiodinium pilosum]|uniref:Nosip protein n=1 Tax=Symbiodinium pilosum TaxID=2952 RepID=A0A812MQ49_SYMPI|nr:nosip [Symbiodinium pilosum]